jgi:hypothetical protein
VAFLEALRASPNVTAAARVAGHARQEFYRLRRDDPGFAEAWEGALEESLDLLEAALFEMGTRGARREVRDGEGRLQLEEHRQDPGSAARLLAAYRPERFSERRRLEIAGVAGAPIELASGHRTTIAGMFAFAVEHDLAGHLLAGLDDRTLERLGLARVEVEQPQERPALPPGTPTGEPGE